MKLFKAIMRPGIVLDVLDGGKIKAEAPGLFTSEDPLEKLPPIMPFLLGNSGQYSEPIKGQEVWILNTLDNPLELFWFRKDRINNFSGVIPEEYKESQNIEVLCDREIGPGQWATIYFSDGSGWIIRNGFASIHIRPNGSILLDSGQSNRVIDICGDSISLGSEGGSSEPAVLGNQLVKVLEKLNTALTKIQTAANSTLYTSPISTALGNTPALIKDMIPKILSPNVTLD